MEKLAITPDNIRGKNFRLPQITGEGSGLGFQLQDLHLPIGWEKAAEYKKNDPGRIRLFLDSYCHEFSLESGEVKFDPRSRVIEAITLRTTPISRVELDQNFPFFSEGSYRARNIRDIKAAIALQRVLGAWLSTIWQEVEPEMIESFALIDGEPGRCYYSHNLTIPKRFLNPPEPITNDYFIDRFKLTASNIAGRFGLTLKSISFDERGLLRDYDIEEGNACAYYLPNTWDGQYRGHVDTPYQAAALHGIGATFINYLLEKEEMQRSI